MKLISLSTAAAVVFALTALPSTPVARASTGIQRCAMPDGSVGYSDRACGAYGAQTAPIPDGMMNRLLATMPQEEMTPGEAKSLPSSYSRRAARAGCARSLSQLEADVRGSFMLGDVNRIAESFYWVGMSNAQGQRVMDRLQKLAQRQVRDTHLFSAQIASLSTSSATTAESLGAGGTLQLLLDGPSLTAVDLDVKQYSGCYFVGF